MWVKDTQDRKNGRLDVKELVDTLEDNDGRVTSEKQKRM